MTLAPDPTSVRLVAAGAALVATTVLADSAIEHYRGSFQRPAMWLPLVASTLSIGFATERMTAPDTRWLPIARVVAQGGAAAVGALGLGFHAYDITRRPGGISFGNLFHAAPIGAPAALILSGALSAAADGMASGRRFVGGRQIAALAAVGIAGTAAEVTLLHFRGAFQHPAMWLPVVVPPLAAASLARDAADSHARDGTYALLFATACLGLLGSALHARGVARRMGGWRNWRQNILVGPPLPAPPAFTGLAIAAIGALRLMDVADD